MINQNQKTMKELCRMLPTCRDAGSGFRWLTKDHTYTATSKKRFVASIKRRDKATPFLEILTETRDAEGKWTPLFAKTVYLNVFDFAGVFGQGDGIVSKAMAEFLQLVESTKNKLAKEEKNESNTPNPNV